VWIGVRMKVLCNNLSIACIVLFFSVTNLLGQAPDILWTKMFGGADRDYGRSVKQTTDGGYIVAGFTYSFGGGLFDVYLVKTNTVGDTLWTKTYGGANTEAGRAVQQTTDGGYIIAGTFNPGGLNEDVYLIKTDSIGDTLWTKKYGWPGQDFAYAVQQTTDGGYITIGFTPQGPGGHIAPNILLIKMDSLGNLSWYQTYGGYFSWDMGFSLQQTGDGGYIIVGMTDYFNYDSSDVYLIKTDANGDTIWSKTFGGASYDYGESVRQTSDGGYIIVGETASFGTGDYDVYLIKTDSLGDTLWTRTYGGDQDESGLSVIESSDGGFVITGMTWSYAVGLADVYVIRTDTNGDTIWTKTIGGLEWDCGWSIQATSDGGYVIAGETKSFGAGDMDFYVIRIAPDTLNINEKKTWKVEHYDFGPTIFSGSLILPKAKKCKVFDIAGRVVMPDKIKAGIYFIEIDGQMTQKVVKIR